MADRRKTGTRKRVKRTWGKPPLRPSSLVAGEVRGELRVINPDTGKRKNGHRMTLVEDIKTGERGEVRADNLLNGNTVSLGRIKGERYREHKSKGKLTLYTDIDRLNPRTKSAARAVVGVDALTGKPIEKATPRKLAPKRATVELTDSELQAAFAS
jgi:hypothetical protein